MLNLATLLFTIIFSGFLLLFVDWNALTEQVRVGGCAPPLRARFMLAASPPRVVAAANAWAR